MYQFPIFHPKIDDFQDHIKMVICPLMQAVTFIDQDGAVRTYKLIDLQRNGCSKVLS